MRKIKIMYLISSLSSCGPVNVLYNIVKYINFSKYDVYIISLSKELSNNRVQDFLQLGIYYKSLNISRYTNVCMSYKKIKSAITEIEPDIIHSQCFRSTIFASLFAKKYKVCTTVHNYPHKDFVMSYGILFGTVMYKMYLAAMKRIQMPIACSKSIAMDLKNKFGLTMTFIRNGIELHQQINQTKRNCKLELNLDTNKITVLCVGNLNNGKNPLFILQNISDLLLPLNMQIVFLGDGKLWSECVSYADSNVKFMGKVDNVYSYLFAADIFVSASLTEGMPNAVLEALSCGVPVLLSDISPHKEIYDLNNKIGNLFTVNNGEDFRHQLTELVKNYDTSMQASAIDVIEKYFTAEEMSYKYQELYMKLLE